MAGKTKKDTEKLELAQSPALDIIQTAKRDAQVQRHDAIDKALDAAMSVVQRVLEDENVDDIAKMFPAKLAVDAYMTKEKFAREDEKLDLERAKLKIDVAKLSQPGGPLHVKNVQNNITINQINGKPKKPTIPLGERKRLAAQMLEEASGVAQGISEDDIEDKNDNN